jgi:hypothetical protein
MPAPSSPALPSASPQARSRKRLWFGLAAFSIGWKVVLFTLGAAVPRWVIGDGLDLVPAEGRFYAQQAKVTALSLWNHPLERLGIVQALRVIRVDRVPAASALATKGCQGRLVTVRAYTYFAIPYSEARTTCDTGVVQYRVFRGKS